MKAAILNIKSIILENMSNPQFSVEQLAEKAGISTVSLRDLVFKYYSKTPKNLIESYKLEYALDLISKNNAIKVIAIKTGIWNARTFRRIFKKHLHLSPRDCREWLLKNPGESKTKIKILRSVIWKKSEFTNSNCFSTSDTDL